MTSSKPPMIVKSDNATEIMRVDSSGKIGVNTTTPTNPLHVNGNTGLRQNSLYLSGGNGWSSLSYNAHHNDANSQWVFPEPSHAAVTIEVDDHGGLPRFQVWSTTSAAPTTWIPRLAVDGNSGDVVMGQNGGNVGIGTAAPISLLQVRGDIALEKMAAGPSRSLPAEATMIWNDGGWLRLNQNLDYSKPIFGVQTPGLFAPGSLNVGGANGWADPGSGNAWFAGSVGIGTTTNPQKPLDVAASGGIRISQSGNASSNNELYFQDNGQIRSLDDYHRIIFDREHDILELREHGDLVFSPGAASGTRTQTVTFKSDGKVGIGTTDPKATLEILGQLLVGGPIEAKNTSGGIGVYGGSDSSTGVYGNSSSGSGIRGSSLSSYGVYGTTTSGVGVYGGSDSSTGVYGNSSSGYGVIGTTTSGVGVYGGSSSSTGVYGSSNSSTGVYGNSSTGYGVIGTTTSGVGVYGGSNTSTGISGYSDSGSGVYGSSNKSIGVRGFSNSNIAVYGSSNTSTGVYGYSQSSIAVYGSSSNGYGIYGSSNSSVAVYGYSSSGNGIYGYSNSGIGVWGYSASGLAGQFYGSVSISGKLSKGGGGFKIDHPLDPANRYLSHSFVESPDMKNLYDGIAILDTQGETIVELPPWFEALNQEFRYQLTPIGARGPNLYIAEEISDQRFKIAGGSSGMKVCWLVTGSRKDAWAQANPLLVEEEKSARERDHYLHPEVYGHTLEKSIISVHHPEVLRRLVEEQQKPPEVRES